MVRFTAISSRLAGVLQVQRAWTPGSLLWVLSLPWFQPDAPHPLVNSLMPFKSLYRFVLSERFGTVAQLAVTGKPFLSASDPTPGHSFPTRATRPQPCQRRLAVPQGNPPRLDLTFRGFREARHLAPCRTAEAGCGQSRDPEPAFNPRLLGPEPCSHPTSRSRYFSGVLRITDAILGECDMIFRLKKKKSARSQHHSTRLAHTHRKMFNDGSFYNDDNSYSRPSGGLGRMPELEVTVEVSSAVAPAVPESLP